ncbi:MAG: GNAT family N-acetyltransferase [Candidatus Brocadiales bacterium]|nr:GNAT family N-acetyltransferase [Candidatus Brocadiales bacterium]
MSDYKTRYLTRNEYKDWDALVLRSPNYSVFDTTLWLDTLSSVLKSDIRILGVFNKGDLIGGVAFNVIKRFGMKIAKVPPMSAFNSCHYIPKETQHKVRLGRFIQEIVIAIAEKLEGDFFYAFLANHPEFQDIRGFTWKDWRQIILYSYRVPLNKMDLSLISASKRRQVKKAQKRLIAIEEVKDVAPVYDIIKNTYLRQGIECPLTLNELSGICDRMGYNMIINAAREQNNGDYKAVIVYVVDYRGKCVYNLINGHEHEIPDSGANTLLIWEGIKFFKDKGFEYYDLGEAGMSSKANFKGEFYTDLVPYYQVSKSNFLFSIAWHLTKGKIARN